MLRHFFSMNALLFPACPVRTRHGGSGWLAYGVTSVHDGSGDRFDYDCNISGATMDQKNYCRTIQTAGAFVLIFGLIAILTSFALLVLATMHLVGLFQLEKFNSHIPTLSNIQWIALQAMVMIWVRRVIAACCASPDCDDAFRSLSCVSLLVC